MTFAEINANRFVSVRAEALLAHIAARTSMRLFGSSPLGVMVSR
jgi:hypothetical protein